LDTKYPFVFPAGPLSNIKLNGAPLIVMN